MTVAGNMKKRAGEKEERALRRRVDSRVRRNRDGVLRKVVDYMAEQSQGVKED